MSKPFYLFSDINMLINDSISQGQDRDNDLFSFPDEDNRIPSISNVFNENIDNAIIEKYTKTYIEKISSDNNLFDVNKVSFSENNSSIKKNKNSKLGRKRKNENIKGEHNKFSDDILRRKCKHIILDNVFIFINEQIKKLYNNNIGDGYFRKELLTLNKEQKSKSNVKYNQEFLTKTLGEIFSDDISTRYSNYSKQHNKLLIKNLINEDNFLKEFIFKNYLV